MRFGLDRLPRRVILALALGWAGTTLAAPSSYAIP